MISNRQNWALQLSTIVVSTACFLVMGAALLFSQNLKNLLTLWGEDIQMTVYLSQEISPEQSQKIEMLIKSQKNVGDVKLITQEKALGEFRTQLATYAPDLVKDDSLLKLIPASYQVSLVSNLKPDEQLSTLQSMAATVRQEAGVDEVSYGQDWVEKYSLFVSAIQWMIEVLAIIIVTASVFVMSNSIRALVQSKTAEIEVLELIGATPMMIRRPFLIEGALMGLISSTLALIACFGLYRFVHHFFTNQLSFLQLSGHLQFLSHLVAVLFVLSGGLLGALGSYICVRKINNGWAASQRT